MMITSWIVKYKLPALWACTYLMSYAGNGQNKTYLMSHYNNIAAKYLIKDKQVWNYVTINQNGVFIYSSPEQKKYAEPEFSLPWEELQHFKDLIKYADRQFQFYTYTHKGNRAFDENTLQAIEILKQNHQFYPVSINKPLSGYRIAIDPGHVANTYQMAQIEQRFISVGGEGNKLYQFYEAELNLSTALVLKDSLEKKGAEVFLTKDSKIPHCVHKSFDRWYKEDFRKELKSKGMSVQEAETLIRKMPKSVVFAKYYSRKDLDARADKINYFKPDLTIVIHYNADSEKKHSNVSTQNNYCLSFVPGAYLKDEMNTQLDRFDFLRVLLTEHLSESTKLSGEIIDEFEDKLGIPSLDSDSSPFYIKNFSLKVEKGIYARNLRLCRLLNSPIFYGEPLLQDNVQELEYLHKNDLSKGKICQRVVTVANAYLKGVIRYINLKKKETGL